MDTPYLYLVSISEQDMADDDATSNSTGTTRSSWLSDAYDGRIGVVPVFLVVLLVIIVGRHVIRKAPPLQGLDIQLLSLDVSNFSVSTSRLRGTYHMGFKIKNPNKMDMSLEEFGFSMLHGGVELARSRVQELNPIPLETTKEKDVKVSMVTKAAGPSKLRKKVFAEMEEEWSRKVVNFHGRMQLTVGFGAVDSPPKSSKLFNLTCGPLRVFFYGKRKDAGRLMGIEGGENDCVVDMTKHK